jgi:hypothetical protein
VDYQTENERDSQYQREREEEHYYKMLADLGLDRYGVTTGLQSTNKAFTLIA